LGENRTILFIVATQIEYETILYRLALIHNTIGKQVGTPWNPHLQLILTPAVHIKKQSSCFKSRVIKF